MVNVTFSPEGNPIYTQPDGTEVLYNLGDMAWIIVATALVWWMIPGVGFLYSGLLRRKNGLSMLMLSVAGLGVGAFQWFFWGYSLAFSEANNPFIGNLKHFGLIGVLDAPSIGSSRIPALLFCIYQSMFAIITGILMVGGFAERARIGPVLLFIFCWLTIVYCPIAMWTWNASGWSFVLGGLDFAGGSPVHISSGTAAFAISIYLGKRRGYGTERLAYKPHSTFFVILGTICLWVGWFGFNGGSALAANLRAVMACMVTTTAASVGGLTWMIMDWRLERKWSAVGFCSGAICGLVGITPASGFVAVPASVAIGVVTAACCNLATRLKYLLNVDDTLDIFASHAVGGMVGCILTGLFADSRVAALDGTVIPGGWLNHHYIQLGYQIADMCSAFGWSLVVTTLLCWIFHFIPGLRLRSSEEEEIVGIDDAELGEFLYDYIALDPELRLHRVESSHGSLEAVQKSEHPEAPAAAVPDEKVGGGRVDV